MTRILAGVLLFAVSFVTSADDKKDDKKSAPPTLTGRWVKEADEFGIEMKFGKDTYATTVKSGDNKVVVTSKYTVDKDGKVKAEITEVKETGSFPQKPEKGTKFTFTFKIDTKAKTAKLTDFEMPGAEGAKDVIEGDYKEKKAD
ncbi:MAG TPA: hypothetical protein VGJ05_22270 [Fimbriiglobus sp.]|jgi:hypothetical protein